MTSQEASREILEAVPLCTPDGRLNPDAVGWSRHPLHRCNLRGARGRKKRWDYWCVTSQECILSVTYADLDYLGMVAVMFHHLPSGRTLESAMMSPLGLGFRQPETVAGADITLRVPGLRLAIREEGDATRITVRYRTLRGKRVEADLRIALPPDHETLNVVVPWSQEQFQFTSKHNTRPAEGRVIADGEIHTFGEHNQSYGCLDYGRGVWPRKSVWNWASASGRQGDRVVGLQLGGQWTDGTGQTENGLCVDGRLSKIHEDVRFDFERENPMGRWHIHTPDTSRVELTLAPRFIKPLRVNLGFGGARCDLCFGDFEGTVVPDDGEPLSVTGLFGWAEEMHARW